MTQPVPSLARSFVPVALLFAAASCASTAADPSQGGYRRASDLPDLSGMVALGDGRFLAVHDSKVADELDRPRVSLVRVPDDPGGVQWKELDVAWPDRASNDLESAASIPGTDDLLLVESGDDGDGTPRLYRATLDGERLEVEAHRDWPVAVFNVEASAVARFGERFVFVYAERAENRASTEIRWAEFEPRTLAFGDFRSVTLPSPDLARTNRPMVALDIGPDGALFVAAAFDSEAAGLPRPDDGPFASSVWKVGAIALDGGEPTIRLLSDPRPLGVLDGYKVESIALTTGADGELQLYVGLDDENYGATLRRLPLAD